MTKEYEMEYSREDELLEQIAELEKENKELKADNKALREKVHWWKKEVNVAHRARADEFEKLVIENKVLKRKLTKAKELLEKLLIVFCNSEILIQYPNCKEVLEARVALEQFLMEK